MPQSADEYGEKRSAFGTAVFKQGGHVEDSENVTLFLGRHQRTETVERNPFPLVESDGEFRYLGVKDLGCVREIFPGERKRFEYAARTYRIDYPVKRSERFTAWPVRG